MKPSAHVQPEAAPAAGTIPPPVQISTALPRPKPSFKPETYSVVVNNVDVHELLFALARDAKLNIDVHAGLKGQVTLNAIDQTLPQLLYRISKQVDMRWEMDGPNLMVMPDMPFLRSYRVDYPAMERKVVTTVNAEAQVSSGGAGGSGGGSGSGSGGTKITITQENSF